MIRFPKVLYVYREEDSDGVPYYAASIDPGELEEGIIGIYHLDRKARVRHQSQFQLDADGPWLDVVPE